MELNNLMIAFMVLLGCMFISRAINEKATKVLDPEKKVALIDVFSQDRMYTSGILIAIIVLFFLSLKFNWINPFISYVVYIASIIIFLGITTLLSYKKLKANNFPASYIKSYLLSTSFRFLGIVIFFALLN